MNDIPKYEVATEAQLSYLKALYAKYGFPLDNDFKLTVAGWPMSKARASLLIKCLIECKEKNMPAEASNYLISVLEWALEVRRSGKEPEDRRPYVEILS